MDLMARKHLHLLGPLAGPGSSLFDALLLVSPGVDKRLENHSSTSNVSLCRGQNVPSSQGYSVSFMRMLVPEKKGREEEGLRWDLGTELYFGLGLCGLKTTCKLVSGRTVTMTTAKVPRLLGWGLQQLL